MVKKIFLSRYPNFKGYLYMNDDTLLNWWTFLNLDKDKIWLSSNISTTEQAFLMGRRPVPLGPWLGWKDSAIPCEQSYKEILQMYKNSRYINTTRLKRTHLSNGNGKLYCFNSWADLFYIPKRLSDEYQRISSVFFKNRVFLEIAVATISSFLDLKSMWETHYGLYLPDKYGSKTLLTER